MNRLVTRLAYLILPRPDGRSLKQRIDDRDEAAFVEESKSLEQRLIDGPDVDRPRVEQLRRDLDDRRRTRKQLRGQGAPEPRDSEAVGKARAA